jgi:UTP--glucose-1-phosphate uridylyltransferase
MHVDGEPFAVLLGDDLIDPRDPLLTRMIDESERRNATVIALMEVEPSQIHLYGAAAIEATEVSDVVRVTGLVEKPSQQDAPSNFAVIGRYILQPQVLDILDRQEPGRGNEIQLTDALNTLAQQPSDGGGVFGVVFRGRRYDTGDRADWIKANVRLAVEHEELGPELRAWLRGFTASLPE